MTTKSTLEKWQFLTLFVNTFIIVYEDLGLKISGNVPRYFSKFSLTVRNMIKSTQCVLFIKLLSADMILILFDHLSALTLPNVGFFCNL